MKRPGYFSAAEVAKAAAILDARHAAGMGNLVRFLGATGIRLQDALRLHAGPHARNPRRFIRGPK